MNADEGSALKLPEFIRKGLPMNEKTAELYHRSSYKPRQALGRTPALPALCRIIIINMFLEGYSVYTERGSHPPDTKSKSIPEHDESDKNK